jgi:outer membrane protein TolC
MLRRVLAASATLLALGAHPAHAQRADTLLLDLPGAVARALRSGDEFRLATLTLDATSAQLTSARATALPQITLNSSYSQVVRNARAEIVGSLFGQSYNYAASLNISQTVFQGGRALYAWRGASHMRQASRLDEEEVRASVQVDVERAYLNALFATRVVAIQQNGLLLARDRLGQVEQLAASGRAARYDVLRARVEATNLEPVVLQAANNRSLAELELRRLLNIPLSQPVRLTTELDARSAQAVVALVGNAGSETLPDRPTLRSARLAYAARRDAIGVARAGFLPTISVFLRTGFLALPTSAGIPWGVGRTSAALCPEGSAATRSCQNNGWFRDESFGITVSWPLFDGLRAKGDMALATTQARIAELQLRTREEQVSLEVARARAEYDRARAAFEAQRSNADEANEAFQLASLRFTRGLGTQLEVSDAQFALLTSQSNEARSVYDLHLAAAELARSLGRPIPMPTGTNPRSTSSGY